MVDSSAFFLLLTLLSLLMLLQQTVDLLRHHCNVMVYHYERRRVCAGSWCYPVVFNCKVTPAPTGLARNLKSFFWLLCVLMGLFLNIVIFSKTVAM